MLEIQLMIILIIAVGYGITKAGMFSDKARADLTNIVIYVVLPCNIFASFGGDISPEILRQSGIILLVSFGLQGTYIILNKILYRRFSPQRQAVLKYATISNNAGFLGLPVIEAVFGPTGLLFGSIMLIPMRIFMWTSGLSLFTRTNTKEKVKTIATHPCIWAVILGFGYIFAPFTLPEFLGNTIAAIGRTTTVLAMLVVGSVLSGFEVKTALDKDCFYYSFLRLIAIPAVMFGALRLLGVDPLVTGVAVLSAAMPAAVVTAMLAEKYGQDSEFASKTIFVSTLLSIVTLPVIAAVLDIFIQ